MLDHQILLQASFASAIKDLYQIAIDKDKIGISTTKKEFAGDYTIVLFPYLRELKINPIVLGEAVGHYLVKNTKEIDGFNVVKGFLNLSFSQDYWKNVLINIDSSKDFGALPSNGKSVMVEFSSPNTNKPLHLGHIRNILLGWSCSKILQKAGYKVIKTQLVNDRGIAVCKSMIAWQNYGEGSTPESTNKKGDHFVGEFYRRFEIEFQKEYKVWQEGSAAIELVESKKGVKESEVAFFKKYKNEYFNTHSALGKQAKEMLIKWEQEDVEVRQLWKMMNAWVYEGFDSTYDKLGIEFDKLYYESQTYLLGKEAVDYGRKKELFYDEEDGSVWIDLEDAGYDKKILLRSDGTAVYMTQDLGTAMHRYQDYGLDKMVYVVADEQDYHFQVLFEILKRLEEPYAENLFHLSYGMVDLPDGRMKSREGTVVDADDLIDEVIKEARKSSEEREEGAENPQEIQEDLLRMIGMAALKFFIIKVSPKKRMVFNPKDSVDMQGQTGPYIQNAYVRIQSILRRADVAKSGEDYSQYEMHNDEKTLIQSLGAYPEIIRQAAEAYDPSSIANYLYALAKAFHKFYHDFRIMGAESDAAKSFRISLIKNIAIVIKDGLELLGIESPERM